MDLLIQYRVRADKVAEQEAAIREFVAAVKAQADPGYRYTVYRKEDGVSLCTTPGWRTKRRNNGSRGSRISSRSPRVSRPAPRRGPQ